jgi:hypothetical protein
MHIILLKKSFQIPKGGRRIRRVPGVLSGGSVILMSV